ncbi:MAG: hypothetical protein ABJ056_18180 [Halioglobus sp.]
MINGFATISSRLSIVFAILFTIAACGGGGGSSSGGFIPDGGGSGVPVYNLEISFFDRNGNPTNSVTSASAATVEVLVTKKGSAKTPAASILVSGEATIGELSPAAGTALSNENGIARFQLATGGELGAGAFTASVAESPDTVPVTFNYQITQEGLRLGSFSGGVFLDGVIDIQPEGQLSPSGIGALTIAVADGDGNYSETEELVKITSNCLISGKASIDPLSPVPITGQSTITYTATGCEGDDVITATLSGSANSASGTVSVAPLTANAISFQSAEPELIVLKGTGGGTGRQESSNVSFVVVDTDNNPVPGISVEFALSTSIGGLSLGNTTGTSDSVGIVSTSVFSGNVATVVRVFARILGNNVSTTSDVLSVSTGLPDQNSISLSVGDGGFTVENGFSQDGVERCITVRMADKYNNLVPLGTSAVFTTEYGSIDSSCILGVSNGERARGSSSKCSSSTPPQGACEVSWITQEPRLPTIDPSSVKRIDDSDYTCSGHNGTSGPCPNDLGGPRGGRSTILVTSVGEESFVDQNGNGAFDEGEPFVNLPEAFIDHNEDGVFTPVIGPNCTNPPTSSSDCEIAGFEETFVDFNNNGVYDENNDPEFYNGTLCPPEGDGVYCDRSLISVRAQTVLTLSANPRWDILIATTSGRVSNTATEGVTYDVFVSDVYNNAPPGGSIVTFSTGGDCRLVSDSSFEVPDTVSRGAFGASLQIDGDGGNGTVTAKLDPAENGTPYSETFNCSTTAPPDPNDPNGGLTVGG